MPVVLDLTHTAHCRSHTGLQQVCRQLLAALAELDAAPTAVVYDPYASRWRSPDVLECSLLATSAAAAPGQSRSEFWTLGQKVNGFLRRGAEPNWAALQGASLIAPEIFSPKVFTAYAGLRARLDGKAVAVFHDAVALRFPDLTPPASVARTKKYLSELATFDGIAANSAASRSELLEYWKKLGLRDHPPVEAIPLGISRPEFPAPLSPPQNEGQSPVILSVGTIEGRKNHLALLEAAELLWSEGHRFRLVLAGLPRPETAAPALALAAKLQAAGRSLETPGPVPDSVLEDYYKNCQFTVYPSLYEGFGLPVAESLLRGRPCICGSGGALAEVAAGGGCIIVPEPTAPHLAQAMRTLLSDTSLYSRLASEAAQRHFPTWSDYARRLLDWLGTLPRRRQS